MESILQVYMFTQLHTKILLTSFRYVTLVGRLLGMRLVYFRPNMTRRVSFELMNRQLVWHGFAVCFVSFLDYLFPLLIRGINHWCLGIFIVFNATHQLG